jgi:protein SCO1/2
MGLRRTSERVVCAVLLTIALTIGGPALGAEGAVAAGGRGDIGVTEHLGESLPLDAPLVDQHGQSVRLGDYFTGQRPVLLIFGYHTCPMLCSLVQNATAQALRGVGWRVGREFEVVVVSIDPEDTPHESTKRRDIVVGTYNAGRPAYDPAPDVRDGGWHYLVGEEAVIRQVTGAAGFRYSYDAAYKQYAHPAVIQIVTPQGKLARYLYGLEFEPSDVRFGLLEAAAGRSVSTIDKVLLFCMHFDPGKGRYVVVAARVMQVGGGICLLGVTALLAVLWMRERRLRQMPGAGPA